MTTLVDEHLGRFVLFADPDELIRARVGFAEVNAEPALSIVDLLHGSPQESIWSSWASSAHQNWPTERPSSTGLYRVHALGAALPTRYRPVACALRMTPILQAHQAER